ncbi:MAG: hypothetical protein U0941_26235 [Planctomycetaceae bacterium]
MLCNGANLQLLEDRGVTLYSPIKMADPTTNPARRPDLSQPVPQKSWDQLPVASITVDGKKLTQLDKDAFVYDASQDCYWCPTAQALPLATTSTEKLKTGNQVRRRYKSDATKCAMCALRERCLKPRVTIREISRFEHDHLREAAGTAACRRQRQSRNMRGDGKWRSTRLQLSSSTMVYGSSSYVGWSGSGRNGVGSRRHSISTN